MLVGLYKFRFGNLFGSFLTNIACGNLSGFHIIILNHGQTDMFFHQLPYVIVNPLPASNYSTASNSFNSICRNDTDYPWGESSGYLEPTKMLPFMRLIARPAMHLHMESYFDNVVNTTLYIPIDPAGQAFDRPNLLDILPPDQLPHLPSYPDVVIHYRCSDNVFNRMMGLLPFDPILRHIPRQARQVTVHRELHCLCICPLTFRL